MSSFQDSLTFETSLPNYTGIEREIIVFPQENQVLVYFTFRGLNDEFPAFEKVYNKPEVALEHIENFLKIEQQENAAGFEREDESVTQSMYRFFEDLLAERVALPDKGAGYELKGDKNYLQVKLDRYKNSLPN
ncbi:hypothetical protein [Spirosoma jeollabukense]